MFCPYCNQGLILKAKIKFNKQVIFICDECDTVWNEFEPISNHTGKGLNLFSKELNITPLWNEFELIN